MFERMLSDVLRTARRISFYHQRHISLSSTQSSLKASVKDLQCYIDTFYGIVQSTWARLHARTRELKSIEIVKWMTKRNSVYATFGTSAFTIQCERRIFIAFYLNCMRSLLMRFRHFICASLFNSKAFNHRKYRLDRWEPHTMRKFSATNTIETSDCYLIHLNNFVCRSAENCTGFICHRANESLF